MNPLSALGGGGFSGSSSAQSSVSGENVFGSVHTGGGTAGQLSQLLVPTLALGGILFAVVMLGRRG